MVSMDIRGQTPPTMADAASVAPRVECNDAETKILRVGDLVRIRKISDARLTKYDGYLGKVNLSKPINQEDVDQNASQLDRHPFLYDIDFVLGGRISNCHRHEILYTTADAEGMSDAVSRSKRSRKPICKDDAPGLPQAKKPVSKKSATEKVPSKKATAGGKKLSVAPPKTVKKKTDSKHKPSGRAKPKLPKAKQPLEPKKVEPVPLEHDDAAITKDLFEKHRREFKKCFQRLEKQDHFGFFFEVPQKHVSSSDANRSEGDQGLVDNDEFQSTIDGDSTNVDQVAPLHPPSGYIPPCDGVPASQAKEVNPFEKPPLTWFDLRERLDANRYVVDRLSKAEKERKKRLGPYIWDKRKKRKLMEQEGSRNIERWEMQDIATKGAANHAIGKRNLTRHGIRVHPRVLHPRGVDWELFRSDVLRMCEAHQAGENLGVESKAGTIGHSAKKIKDFVEQMFERTARKQMFELEFADTRHEFTVLLKAQANQEAALQGEWRKICFQERKYEHLKSDVVCSGLSRFDQESASYEKQTELPDSFVGLAYTYNNTSASEGWMKSVFETTTSKASHTDGLTVEEERAACALATDDGVVRAQVRATMRTLLIGVQDKVLTDRGVLKENELRSSNWDALNSDKDFDAGPLPLQMTAAVPTSTKDVVTPNSNVPDVVEQSVWGIDCYTRQNVIICIEKDLDPETAVEFVEKWLLPAINACPIDLAHDLANAARILEGLPLRRGENDSLSQLLPLPVSSCDQSRENWSHSLIGRAFHEKINVDGPPWLKAASRQLRRAIASLGYDFFRVHPKGHGSIVLRAKVKANTLVTFYRGEVYPSWRWGEKLDAIAMTQNFIGLRPNLPDFYNMALERPQMDRRGYGLMIVDASRKAGHGSMLSHSCDPTCEVRVAALNGQLCLAMTTLRDVEQGEELTFDYNAVTESLEEYKAAICLCGHKKCRGSFLHFATADCYQRVLNRNSPVAVRFANLVKGCTKKVMADEDIQTLNRHGFGTAAFGAISFDRHMDINATLGPTRLDSLANVPVWLRTYVADVLRYIEYERRALPVALLCDHFKADESGDKVETPVMSEIIPTTSSKKRQKGEPRAKPENSFQYFVRVNKETFLQSLAEEKGRELKGMEAQHAIRTVGSTVWKTFSDQEKTDWKERAIADWEQSKAVAVMKGDIRSNDENATTAQSGDTAALNLSRISFEAADAEGVSAMEQRIQQLTQALSRIGRVLDHHREKSRVLHSTSKLTTPAPLIHPPLSIMTDREVVAWMWCDQDGLLMSLFRSLQIELCLGTSLHESLTSKAKKYRILDNFVANPNDAGLSALEARRTLTAALLDLRECLNDGLQELAKDFRRIELQKGRLKAKARRDEVKQAVTRDVQAVLQELVELVAKRSDDPSGLADSSAASLVASTDELVDVTQSAVRPWIEHYRDRWKLEAAADILLLYARTSTFFKIIPYSPVKSTPIEVYSRELGNCVPVSAIKRKRDENVESSSSIVLLGQTTGVEIDQVGILNGARTEGFIPSSSNGVKKSSEPVFDPDEVVASVTLSYSGEYVVSQLLQWFNGGVGQKQCLPDMNGCAILPSIEASLASSSGHGGKAPKSTRYRSQIRPRLLDWLRDPHQRGSAFPEELSKVLKGPDMFFDLGKPLRALPIGSPVLDLLVMGDDTNINAVLAALDRDRRRDVATCALQESATTRLESTIDEAMPAQAIAKWVQCEREECLKWRRLPFYVDIDILPEQFFCKDNIWNPEAQSCDAPEDVWDDYDSQIHNGGIEKASDKEMQSRIQVDPVAEVEAEPDYEIGDRYDVLRSNKTHYCTGEVVDIDCSKERKRVKLHFPKVPEKFDEWIEVPSSRIAPLQSKQIQTDGEKHAQLTERCNKSSCEKQKAAATTTIRDPDSIATSLLFLRHSTPLPTGEEIVNCVATSTESETLVTVPSDPPLACEQVSVTTSDVFNGPLDERFVDANVRSNSVAAAFTQPSSNEGSAHGEEVSDVNEDSKSCISLATNGHNDKTDIEGKPKKPLGKKPKTKESPQHEMMVCCAPSSLLNESRVDRQVGHMDKLLSAIPRKRKCVENLSQDVTIAKIVSKVNAESCPISIDQNRAFLPRTQGQSAEQMVPCISTIAASTMQYNTGNLSQEMRHNDRGIRPIEYGCEHALRQLPGAMPASQFFHGQPLSDHNAHIPHSEPTFRSNPYFQYQGRSPGIVGQRPSQQFPISEHHASTAPIYSSQLYHPSSGSRSTYQSLMFPREDNRNLHHTESGREADGQLILRGQVRKDNHPPSDGTWR